ncbi:flippase [Kluyvera cryocrescens]|uniref:flippase n=1 Tax=Kluyvera cryocrescens TaxID=580 RepID=UPI002DBE1044|nr:flippase [Kluyvera cryocrescens]MEB7713075.1 flippase [Kluyvera cryocrescens]
MKINNLLNRNIFYLSIVQGSNFLLPLITFPYLVRVLGPHNFGLLGFCQATMQYLVLLTDYGFNWTGTRLVATNKNNANKIDSIFWSILYAKIAFSIIALLILIVLCVFIEKYNSLWLIMLSLFPMVIGSIIYPIWFFQGLEKMRLVTICTVTSRLLIIPFIFVYVREPSDILNAALIQSLVYLVAGIMALIIIKRKGLVNEHCFNVNEIIKCITDSWYIFISTSAISLYTTSTAIILGFVSGPAAVGYFNAANTIRSAAQNLLTPITQALYPHISGLIVSDYKSALTIIRKSLRIVGFISFVGGVLLFCFSPQIVEIGIGKSYVESIDVLRIMAFVPFIVMLSNIFGVQTMLPLNYKKQFSMILIIGAVFNLCLIFPLTILYSQNGAALSLLSTEILVTVLMYIFIKRKRIGIF